MGTDVSILMQFRIYTDNDHDKINDTQLTHFATSLNSIDDEKSTSNDKIKCLDETMESEE